MRLSIHYKITLAFAPIIAAILFGVYFYLNTTQKVHTYKQLKKSLLNKTTYISSSQTINFSKKNIPYLEKLAEDMGEKLNVRVTLIDISGTILADSHLDGTNLPQKENYLYRPEIKDALTSKTGESRRFSTMLNKEMLFIAAVSGKGKPEGIIRLALPLIMVEEVSRPFKKRILITILAAFFLSTLFIQITSALILKPIKEISIVANKIAKGDFSKKISVNAQDEIGDLALAFQDIVFKAKRKIKEVTVGKSRFEAVLLSMAEGVMVVNTAGTILLMNQRFKDFFLIKTDPIEKKPLEIIRNSAIQEIVDESLKLRQTIKAREISVLSSEEKILLVQATPIIREKKLDGSILVFRDITELRKLEKIRRDFVANVSHELRTPITSIKGYAETLLDGALKDEKNAINFLKIIYADSKRMSLLIDDLLDLTRLESGKLHLVCRPCALGPIIQKVEKSFARQFYDNQITFINDILFDLPLILADETKIVQVFQNLIDNAIKYNRKGGTITLSAKEAGRYIQVDVKDTGVGIPPNKLPRLFERFYRVDDARSQKIGGTGLGLSIVKHIIMIHTGQVFVKSEPGYGSAFSFTLPIA